MGMSQKTVSLKLKKSAEKIPILAEVTQKSFLLENEKKELKKFMKQRMERVES